MGDASRRASTASAASCSPSPGRRRSPTPDRCRAGSSAPIPVADIEPVAEVLKVSCEAFETEQERGERHGVGAAILAVDVRRAALRVADRNRPEGHGVRKQRVDEMRLERRVQAQSRLSRRESGEAAGTQYRTWPRVSPRARGQGRVQPRCCLCSTLLPSMRADGRSDVGVADYRNATKRRIAHRRLQYRPIAGPRRRPRSSHPGLQPRPLRTGDLIRVLAAGACRLRTLTVRKPLARDCRGGVRSDRRTALVRRGCCWAGCCSRGTGAPSTCSATLPHLTFSQRRASRQFARRAPQPRARPAHSPSTRSTTQPARRSA